jgi:serine/threonine protein kinase
MINYGEVRDSGVLEVFIAMEFCSSSLVGLLERCQRQPLPEERVWEIFEEIVSAVAFLHSCNPPIIHRDLKVRTLTHSHTHCCQFDSFWQRSRFVIFKYFLIFEQIENVLIGEDEVFKLCDFGSCTTREMVPTARKDILQVSVWPTVIGLGQVVLSFTTIDKHAY